MKIRTFYLISAFCFITEFVPTLYGATDRPNVVLLVVDDLGYGEPGCYGGTSIPTPNLDQIAKEGVRFTQAYVTASYCAPSRAAIMTGRSQHRFGFTTNPVGAMNCEPGVGLPVSETTLAQMLVNAGYHTSLVGKWHLGGTAPMHPMRRGFQEFFGFLHEGHTYCPPPYEGVTSFWRRKALPDGKLGRSISKDGKQIYSTHMGTHEPPYDADNPLQRGSQPVEEKAFLTDAFTREGIDFVGRHRDEPFFLYLAYNAVHSPMQAPDKYMKKYSHIEDVHRRVFAAMLSNLDDNVGHLLAALKKWELDESTLIIVLSDNGGPTKELTSRNDPLSGGKGNLLEGGIRVPMLVRWKGKIPAGQTCTDVVWSPDIVPTVLGACNITPPKKVSDGLNLLPLLKREASLPTRTMMWEMGQWQALRQGNDKIVRQRRTGKEAWQLYSLQKDIAEKHDLAATLPQKVEELATQFEQWQQLMKTENNFQK